MAHRAIFNEAKALTVNQFLFQMSQQQDKDNENRRLIHAGAFPSPTNDDHVFADESFADESSNEVEAGGYNNRYKLEDVKEETSRGSTDASAPPIPHLRHKDTPAVKKLSEEDEAFRTPPQHPPRVETKPSTSSSGVSDLTYPYTLYNNLAKARDEREESSPHRVNSRLPPRQRPNDSSWNNAQRTSNLTDVEAASNPYKLMSAPTEGDDSSSLMIDQQSDVIKTVTSTRSQQNKQYTRHTLTTSLQVTAYPAAMLTTLFIEIEQKRHMHKLTAQHIRVVQDWLLFTPAVTLTLLSGIMIFVFETNLNVNANGRVYASIVAGTSALLSVFLQALNKQLDLGTQGSLHESTAGTLKRLSEDILLSLSSTDAIPPEYVALVGEKLDQAMYCPSTLPYKLEAAFTAVLHRVNLMLSPPMGQAPRKHINNLDMMRLYSHAYEELTSEIIHNLFWPLMFPEPRKASDTALRNFKVMITEGHEAKRKGWIETLIETFLPCFNYSKKEKSLYDVVPTASIVGEQESAISYQTPKRKPNPHFIRSSMLGEEL
jgi:hypothetical protein